MGRGKLGVLQVLRACVCFFGSSVFNCWSWNNLILKESIWAESHWEDVGWWWSRRAMYGLRSRPRTTRLAIECFPGFQIQCLSPTPQTLFGRSQLRQEILEQNCKGNCLSVFFRSWFFFFSLLCQKCCFQSVYMIWERKRFFKVTNNLSVPKKKIIQRGQSWPTTELLFSMLLRCYHQHGECLFYSPFCMWRQGSRLFLPSQLPIASLGGYI